MSALSHAAYLDHIRTESARFREVLTGCDPATRVPACPDWDAADLVWHLAEVQLFWSRVVRLRPASPDDIDLAPAERPASYRDLLETFDDFSHALATELERADPGEPAWHWGPDQSVGASFTRQAHEALIHRLDAEQTAGNATGPFDVALAADGVREMLELMRGGELPAWARFDPIGSQVAVELSDANRTFRVQPGQVRGTDPDSGTSYDEGHLLAVTAPRDPAGATVRGTAGDIDAWLWNRRDDTGIEVTGDPAAYAAFRAAVSPPVI